MLSVGVVTNKRFTDTEAFLFCCSNVLTDPNGNLFVGEGGSCILEYIVTGKLVYILEFLCCRLVGAVTDNVSILRRSSSAVLYWLKQRLLFFSFLFFWGAREEGDSYIFDCTVKNKPVYILASMWHQLVLFLIMSL